MTRSIAILVTAFFILNIYEGTSEPLSWQNEEWLQEVRKITFFLNVFEKYYFHILRQITLRIVGYHFSSRLTATLNLCLIDFKIT